MEPWNSLLVRRINQGLCDLCLVQVITVIWRLVLLHCYRMEMLPSPSPTHGCPSLPRIHAALERRKGILVTVMALFLHVDTATGLILTSLIVSFIYHFHFYYFVVFV